ncbi:WSCD family member CG9164-like [Babylonia areolata]|uniref:WSCD family member CG9164-like n=1 Tax=Babylonia areolata TaxID=304850 RepID=UPI003FD36CE9
MAFSRKVRWVWTCFNVLMTLLLFPMLLVMWNDYCSASQNVLNPRLPRNTPGHEDNHHVEHNGDHDNDDDHDKDSKVVVAEKTPCPLPGAGTFSSVRLRSTALASYQGSGNTWARHLLTTATGILTGTVYPNETREVPATMTRAPRLLVIKTHMNPKESRRHFPVDRGILIVRNPYEAILSEFNRGGVNPDDEHADKRHVAVRRPEDFRRGWSRYVEGQMSMWLKFNWYWAKDGAPLHVLVYHRLVEHTDRELREVLHFLNESSIRPTLHCATRHSEGWAHRKKPEWQKELAVFNSSQRTFLNVAIDRIRHALHAKTGHNFDDFERWKR